MQYLRHLKTPAAIGTLLLFAACAAGYGAFDGLVHGLGGNQIIADNRAFLAAARRVSSNDQVVLAELLALLSVVQSAELGFDFLVSAKISVGEALSALSTGIERAWFAVIAAAVVTEVMLGLSLLAQMLAPALLVGALGATGILCWTKAAPTPELQRIFQRTSKVAWALFLIAYLVVPYSIQTSALTTEAFRSEITEIKRESVHQMHAELTALTRNEQEFAGWAEKNRAQSAYHVLTKDIIHRIAVVQRFAVGLIADVLLYGFMLPLAVLAIFGLCLRTLLSPST